MHVYTYMYMCIFGDPAVFATPDVLSVTKVVMIGHGVAVKAEGLPNKFAALCQDEQKSFLLHLHSAKGCCSNCLDIELI